MQPLGCCVWGVGHVEDRLVQGVPDLQNQHSPVFTRMLTAVVAPLPTSIVRRFQLKQEHGVDKTMLREVRYDELQQELIFLHSFVRRINRRHRPSICLGSHARWGHLGPEELPYSSTTSRFWIDVTSIASRCPVHTHAVSAMTDERNGRLWTVRTTAVALFSVLLGAALLACSGLCNGASCWGSRWEVRLV